MGSSDDDDDDGEADENYGNAITDDENDSDDEDDSDDDDDDEVADFIASQEATKYDNYNDYDNNNDIHQTNNEDDEEEEDNEEDEEGDIVMQLEFATMSKEKEQLFTAIIKEEEEKMDTNNSDNNNSPTNRVKSRRRSSVAFSTTDVNVTVDDSDNNNHHGTSTPDSDQQRQRRSSVISLRPSIMSKETAEKVIALLSKETDDDAPSESKSVIMEEKNSTISNTNNEKDDHENNEEQQQQQQELDWDDLSLEKKLNKIKCAAAGGGLVLLGIITTPTPLPTLPLIVAGFHILGQEYEQAKDVEDQLMEKVDAAKTTVMKKYEEYTTTNDDDDQEDADKGAEVDGIITKEEFKHDDVDQEGEKEDEKEEEEEFSDFIVSQWKDHVEIGLRIQYPLPCTNYLVNHTTANDHDSTVKNDTKNTATEVELEGILLDKTAATATTTKSEIEVRTNKNVYDVVLHKKIAATAAQLLESEESTTNHQDVDDNDDDYSSVQCEHGSDTFPADPPHNDDNNDVTRHRLPVLQLSTRLEEQSMAPLFDGTQWAGTRIWKAAVLGLEYIIRLRLQQQQQQQQQQQSSPTNDTTTPPPPTHNSYSSLLELGCGLGVPSMIWKQLLLHENKSNNNDSTTTNLSINSPRVVLTDRDSLLLQLQTNLEHNFSSSSSDEDGSSATPYHGNHQNIVAKTFEWSTAGIQALLQDEQQQQQQQRNPDQCQEKKTATPLFDICLNCDCIYEPLYGRAAWEALADVLIELATQSPTTLLVTSVERRNSDNVDGFLQKLTASGVMEVPIQRVVHDNSDPYHIIEIYTTKGIRSTISTNNVK